MEKIKDLAYMLNPLIRYFFEFYSFLEKMASATIITNPKIITPVCSMDIIPINATIAIAIGIIYLTRLYHISNSP
ncbi:hypothetical protein, partial [Clostridiisalibacter paucivorans]|uniref:hypothetical protein n=1 Tax=Clostridiisalibacter paucivorans TaxID=408753 RepID=UPI00196BB207